MDYLDPRKRRAYHIRLIIGYILVAIVIGLGTVIIVYGANGYGINTKTGQIVENGLLFVDSKPGAAEIYLNGQDRHKTTSARLILPAATYTLTLKRTGYRDWSRTFVLEGQSVARYVYPFLMPQTPHLSTLKSYTSKPPIITESPDRHWLLVQSSSANGIGPVFDQYDTTTLDKTTPAVSQIAMPAGILNDYSAKSKLSVVEWSTDNNNLLLKHNYSGGTEFVVFNRTHPDQSFNVNRIFNVNPTAVNFFNKKASQLYVYDKTDGSLRLGDVKSKSLDAPILTQVLAYKPYGSDLITYVTNKDEPSGRATAMIWDSGQSYVLDELKTSHKYLIDAAKYNGHFYYIVGSDGQDHANIYKDPLNDIKNPAVGEAIAMLALPDKGAQIESFSDNARFIGIESGQHFTVYDFETGSAYRYSVKQPLADNMSWMDGNRFIGDAGGQILIMDFDGTNVQELTPTADTAGGLFSGDYNHLLTLAKAPGSTRYLLQDMDMRAGPDLPQQ
ncbi:MAG TPA: PEGA domain-containing protein [Candidatus Saccharimonadales bacterium]|nr:PEGA domain-containing protein [Candidatus Saccharimonadales bacterium]